MPNIEKRGPNSFRLRIDSGYSAVGKQIQHRKTIKIDDEAVLKSKRKLNAYLDEELVKFRKEIEAGQFTKPEKITFGDFVSTWKKNYADLHMGEYTRLNYMRIVNAHLIPTFGSMELKKIKTLHIVTFLTNLRAPDARKDNRNKPLATNTILNVYKTLKSILDAAEKWRVLSVNPMNGVDRPLPDKQEKKELINRKHSYTTDEVERLIDVLQNEPEHWRLYYLGVLLGGFRRGEMLGMEWAQVDFTLGGLHVEKQISLNEQGRPVETELKTEESAAFVSMPDWYMHELEKFKKKWAQEKLKLGAQWKGLDKQYLLHNGKGQKLYPDTPSLHWRRMLTKYNLPAIRLHDLRHTTATLLREDGADLKSIQERLRHTRLATTADLYTHKTDSISRETANRLDKFNPQTRSKNNL
jgi:integrase